MDRNRFYALDAMRGAAAVLIVIYHGTEGVIPMAYAAVDLFFLLSGFVLAHRHGAHLAAGFARSDFLILRLIRLYPLYLVGLAMGAAVGLFMVGRGIEDWVLPRYGEALVLGAFFLPTPTTAWLGVFPLNGPCWSLFFELVANGVFTVTGWRMRPSLALVLLSAPLLLYAIHRWEGAGGFSYEDFPGGFPRVLFSFFLGVVIYRLIQAGRLAPPSLPVWLWLAALPLLYLSNFGMEAKYHAALIFVLQPALLALTAKASVSDRLRPAMIWLGAVSYGLYVLHAPIQYGIEVLARPAAGLTWDDSAPAYVVLITLPLSLALAHLLTFRFDEPVRRWLRGRLRAVPRAA